MFTDTANVVSPARVLLYGVAVLLDEVREAHCEVGVFDLTCSFKPLFGSGCLISGLYSCKYGTCHVSKRSS